jgi:Lsr2
LSTAHSEELHKVLAGYVTCARRAAGTARRAPRGRRGADPLDTRKVREWAKGQGIDVRERGRVPR